MRKLFWSNLALSAVVWVIFAALIGLGVMLMPAHGHAGSAQWWAENGGRNSGPAYGGNEPYRYRWVQPLPPTSQRFSLETQYVDGRKSHRYPLTREQCYDNAFLLQQAPDVVNTECAAQ